MNDLRRKDGDVHLERVRLGPGSLRVAAVALAAAAAGGLGSWLVFRPLSGEALAQAYGSYLTNYVFFLSLGLGALFFVMVTHLTRAGWSVVLRRLVEHMGATLGVLALLAIPLVLGAEHLYAWFHEAAVARDPLLQHKAGYLNPTFFYARLIVYFVFWVALSRYFLRRSVQQDRAGDARITLEMERVSAPGLIAFALTLTFASFDFLMSLTPEWYSTIFGVYYFSGAAVGFFAALTVAAYALNRWGPLHTLVSPEHFHDLGKLTFGFVVFWAYIAFSQYMLIWYANLPEETIWYYERQSGEWVGPSVLLIFGHFFIPFLALLSSAPKRRPGVLAAVCLWVLAMHWVDLYWVVMPELSGHRVPLGWADLWTFLAIGGVFTASFVLGLRRADVVPLRDPRLPESLEFENA